METKIITLNENAQLFIQNHNGEIYTELQVKKPTENEFGDYCININGKEDQFLISKAITINICDFIEQYEEYFL